MPNLIEVGIEQRGCTTCGARAVPGENWRDHGFFVFGNSLAVHIDYLTKIRRSVQKGMPILTAWDDLLSHIYEDFFWMQDNEDMAKR